MMAYAVNPAQVRWHNEATDTTRITNLLVEAASKDLNLGKTMVWVARQFLGTKYVGGTLEGDEELLTVNLDELDCTTFMETCAAMALTVNEGRSSWRDFLYNLERLRYRSGEMNGYASRLHYISDWVVDNTHAGLVREMTDRVGNAARAVKTLDFMSTNRGAYKALADSTNYAEIKRAESAYRGHSFPYLRVQDIAKANIAEGDIIAITSGLKNLDVQHIGIAVKGSDGQMHLLHASSKGGKVLVDPLTIAEYVRRSRSATGIRVIRLTE